jgi:hypothetical protein
MGYMGVNERARLTHLAYLMITLRWGRNGFRVEQGGTDANPREVSDGVVYLCEVSCARRQG